MSGLRRLLLRLYHAIRPGAGEAELDRELRSHLMLLEDEYARRGLTSQAARLAARRSVGGVTQAKDLHREARSIRWLDERRADARYAIRTLRRTPGFTAVVVSTLAVGIGANTAIFSLAYGLLLRPLPYQDPGRLVVLRETDPRVGPVGVSYQNFLDWQKTNRTFAALQMVVSRDFNLAGVNQPEHVGGQAVTPGFLAMLGVHPLIGRDFEAQGAQPGTARVALISYRLWQTQFGGDPAAEGRTVTLDGRPTTIIGVLPADYLPMERTDVIEPIGVWAADHADTANERADRSDSVAVGRLATGVALDQAHRDLAAIASRLSTAYPDADDGYGVALQPIRDALVGDLRPVVLVLCAAVGCVLLIACANIANLLLIRGAGRAREFALRLAIGATRGRIVGQLLVESLVLAACGGGLGLLLAVAGISELARLMPTGSLPASSIGVNAAVFGFAGAAALLSTFLFGLIPAMRAAKANVRADLKEGGRSLSGAHGRSRAVLVVVEVSLALTLLTGAGLMMKSLSRLMAVDGGFRPDHVLTLSMSLRSEKYHAEAAVMSFWRVVLGRVRALPGVDSAALGDGVPLTDRHDRTDITVEHLPVPSPGSFPHPDVHIVSPGYVRALGVRLLRGRVFSDADTDRAPTVAMVNATVVTKVFGGADPVGRRFIFGRPSASEPPHWVTIVGVVGDTKLYGLENPSRLEVYIPLAQDVSADMRLIVRSAGDPAAQTAAIRAVVQGIDHDQPIADVSTMTELVDHATSARRVTLILLGGFSAVALALAIIGIYGVTSYSVARRTREFGIRTALGAGRWEVLRAALVPAAAMAGAGVAVGIVTSLGLTRLMAALLYSVSPTDPATMAMVTTALGTVVLAAAYVPSRRLLRLDPVRALRDE